MYHMQINYTGLANITQPFIKRRSEVTQDKIEESRNATKNEAAMVKQEIKDLTTALGPLINDLLSDFDLIISDPEALKDSSPEELAEEGIKLPPETITLNNKEYQFGIHSVPGIGDAVTRIELMAMPDGTETPDHIVLNYDNHSGECASIAVADSNGSIYYSATGDGKAAPAGFGAEESFVEIHSETNDLIETISERSYLAKFNGSASLHNPVR